jgi:ribosomal subunit interface protein
MQTPPRISFHGLDPSPAIETRVREEVEKLQRFHDRITGCHVTITAPHRRHRQGIIYGVRIDITVPREEIVVSREPETNHAHEDPYVAIRDAFQAARRQLEDRVRKNRGYVKSHEGQPHGRVIRIVPDEQYGFLESDDGLQVYFHENAVVDMKLEDFRLGDEIRFVLAEGEGQKGPQASTVAFVRRRYENRSREQEGAE